MLLAAPSPYIEQLDLVLKQLKLAVLRVYSLAEAERFLTSCPRGWLIFTEAVLPDGDWSNVLNLAPATGDRVRVILVSRLVDHKLYIDALNRGASDLIVAPFFTQDVAHVIHSTYLNEAMGFHGQGRHAIA